MVTLLLEDAGVDLGVRHKKTDLLFSLQKETMDLLKAPSVILPYLWIRKWYDETRILKIFTFGIFGLFAFPGSLDEANGDGVDVFPFSRIEGGDDGRDACWGDGLRGCGVRERPPVNGGCVEALDGCYIKNAWMNKMFIIINKGLAIMLAVIFMKVITLITFILMNSSRSISETQGFFSSLQMIFQW